MEQILLAYGIPKETVAAITILYRNTKVKVWSPDGDTEYFDIVAGVLQGDMLAPYLFIICLDYVIRTSIDKIRENGFEQTKKKKQKVLFTNPSARVGYDTRSIFKRSLTGFEFRVFLLLD